MCQSTTRMSSGGEESHASTGSSSTADLIDMTTTTMTTTTGTTTSTTTKTQTATLEEQLSTVNEKLKRTTKYLHEIQDLSPLCEESSASQDELKEKQVFVRRILQIGAELQDARDALHSACRPLLTERQYELLADESDGLLDDPSLDPSVRFFGVDWQQIFGRCFSLSLNAQIFQTQLVGGQGVDLVLLHSILRDLARIEVDVTSHGEAVLNGRLSKSQQRLILQEQSKYNAINTNNNRVPSATKVSKSKSFRDVNGGGQQQRKINKYKKNKTTDFNKLSIASSSSSSNCANNNNASSISNSTSGISSSQSSHNIVSGNGSSNTSTGSGSNGGIVGHVYVNHNNNHVKSEWQEVMQPKRKSSFIQNVSSLFKNIR